MLSLINLFLFLFWLWICFFLKIQNLLTHEELFSDLTVDLSVDSGEEYSDIELNKLENIGEYAEKEAQRIVLSVEEPLR